MHATMMAGEVLNATACPSGPSHHFGTRVRVIGESVVWQDVLKQVRQVAATDTTVCIEGESGTGKEVVARLIHGSSARRSGPFVAINCATLPEQLFESELFGFERGAFTGALQAKRGQIEVAAGGTLFLDEVSEMTLAAQAKLLRVLQEREYRRLGGTRPLEAHVRVIVATNRNLAEAVTQRLFRADLYYRVRVFDIGIPPLRDRPEDVGLLAESFLMEFAATMGRPTARLSQAAKEALRAHGWPGNVRELRNVLEKATIVCEGGVIEARDLSFVRMPRPGLVDDTNLDLVESQTIERVLGEVGGNKARAARNLGISRTQLYGRLRKHRLAWSA